MQSFHGPTKRQIADWTVTVKANPLLIFIAEKSESHLTDYHRKVRAEPINPPRGNHEAGGRRDERRYLSPQWRRGTIAQNSGFTESLIPHLALPVGCELWKVSEPSLATAR